MQVVEEPGTWLEIATTRPEAIPGDTAIAVNPGPALRASDRQTRDSAVADGEPGALPIVADEHIDIEFGTGVLKVRLHTTADFEIGNAGGRPSK